MIQENTKKIYVVNLDKNRLIIITGVFMFLFGLSFLGGLKWASFKNAGIFNTDTQRVNTPSSEETYENTAVREPEPVALASHQTYHTPSLPKEDVKLFEKAKLSDDDDPFLTEPPGNTKSQYFTLKTVKREQTSRHDPKHDSKHDPKKKKVAIKHSHDGKRKNTNAKSWKPYYTIQIGAFRHEKDALALKNKLIDKGVSARVDGGKSYFFVRYGKSSDRERMVSLLKKIEPKLGLKAIVVKQKAS